MCVSFLPQTTVLNKVLYTRLSVKIALISHWNDFILILLGKCASLRRATKICKKFKFWNFWERPLFNIREYAFKVQCSFNSSPCPDKCPPSNFEIISHISQEGLDVYIWGFGVWSLQNQSANGAEAHATFRESHYQTASIQCMPIHDICIMYIIAWPLTPAMHYTLVRGSSHQIWWP